MNIRKYISTRRNKLNRYKVIKRLLNLKESDRILDLGCGKKSKSFSIFNDQNEIVGLDILDSCELVKSNFTYLKGDGADLPFKNEEFDVVVSIGVLEHIHPRQKFIKMLKEIERTSKKYAIVVPHKYCFIEPHFNLPFWYFYPDFLKRFLISKFNLGSQLRKKDGNYQRLNHPSVKFYLKLLKGSKVHHYFFGPILLYYIIYKN